MATSNVYRNVGQFNNVESNFMGKVSLLHPYTYDNVQDQLINNTNFPKNVSSTIARNITRLQESNQYQPAQNNGTRDQWSVPNKYAEKQSQSSVNKLNILPIEAVNTKSEDSCSQLTSKTFASKDVGFKEIPAKSYKSPTDRYQSLNKNTMAVTVTKQKTVTSIDSDQPTTRTQTNNKTDTMLGTFANMNLNVNNGISETYDKSLFMNALPDIPDVC